jgi:hypothetical protein
MNVECETTTTMNRVFTSGLLDPDIDDVFD